MSRKSKSDGGKPREHIIPIKVESEEVTSTSFEKEEDDCNGDKSNLSTTLTSSNHHQLSPEDNVHNANGDSLDAFSIPRRTLPPYNVPEKIVIVYDSAVDEVNTGFSIGGDTICPNAMLKRSLCFFLFNKHLIDAQHEYALVVINDNRVVWLKDFTNNIDIIVNALEEIPDCEPEDILVLDNLFTLISDKISIPEEKEDFNVPPPYVVRVLFTYGRSFTLPQVNENAKSLVKSPYFTFDILMTHEIPCARNNCLKIFKYLQMIDKKGFAYFFPVGRSSSQLHLSMAKLLSHPLQRPVQADANYSVNGMEV